jgi:chromosome segregation ATPase
MAETPKSLPVEPHVPPVAPKPVSPLEENEVQPIVPPIVPKVTVLAEPTSEVAALREQLEAERKEHAANFSVQAERLQTAEAEAAQAIARAVKAEGRLATVQQDAETRQGTLRDTIDELHDRVEKERGIIRTYEGVIAGLRAKVLQDETERTELLALRDAYAVIQKSKERLDKSLSVVQGKLKEKLEELRTANTALKHLQAKQPEVVSVSTEDVEKLKQELRIARTKSTKAGKKITGLEKELKSLRKDLKETVAQLRATEATLQQLQDERITEMAADSVTPPVTTTELAEAFEYISGLEAQILSLTTALKEVTGQLATANRASERNTTRHERRIAKLSEQLETTKAALKAAEAEVAKAATTIMTRIEAVRAELLFEVEKRVTNSAYEKEELARLRAQFRKSPIQ